MAGAEKAVELGAQPRRRVKSARTMDDSTQRTMAQVASLLHDQLHCVSVGGIASTCGVSRFAASTQLTDRLGGDAPVTRTYRVTTCAASQDTIHNANESIPRTVFRLTTKHVVAPVTDAMDADDSIVYALAVVQTTDDETPTTESLWTAHERELARGRDQLQSGGWTDDIATTLSNDPRMIAPSQNVVELLGAPPPPTKWWQEANAASTQSTAPSIMSKKKVVPTTAASFFGKAKAKSKGSTTAAKASALEDEKENSNAAQKASPKPRSKPILPRRTSAAAKKNVGDADDFVGDVDDDDDPMEVDEPVAKGTKAATLKLDESDDESMEDDAPKPSRNRSKSKKSNAILDDENEDIPKKPRSKKAPKVVEGAGALEAFTQKVASTASQESDQPTRRRIKKWVDQTTVDANGYLHTESREVWVDVSDDEAAAPSAAAVARKAAKKAPTAAGQKKPAMKQGNLMGFFQKK